MPSRLLINLPATWREKHRGDPNGPRIYKRRASTFAGGLHVLLARDKKTGTLPKMNDDELTKIALGFVMRSKEKVLSKATGTTPWGRFACIVSASIAWLTHVWVINKGPDTVIAVHVGPNPASEVEISELKQIVMQISVVEA